MNATPLIALSLVSTFFVCAAAKNGAPTATQPVTLAAHRVASDTLDRARTDGPVTIKAWDIAKVVADHRESKRRYTRFFRVPSTHCGVYTLQKGAKDGQTPHAEDELYYVLAGKAKMECGDETVAVKPGSMLFIAAGATHRFVDIEADLEVLVVFSSGPLQTPGTPKDTPATPPKSKK